jgi:hypothetical protein
MQIDRSDLEKIRDALAAAETFHRRRDEMNAAGHLAAEVRLSPLASTLVAERERAERLLLDDDD